MTGLIFESVKVFLFFLFIVLFSVSDGSLLQDFPQQRRQAIGVPIIRTIEKKSVVEKPNGKRKRFTLPDQISNPECVEVYINGKLQKEDTYTIYSTKRCVVFNTAPKSCNRITVSYKTMLFEEKYFMSFEGMRLEDSRTLTGIDDETGFNANYYSKDRKNVTFKGTRGKSWAEIVRAPERQGMAIRFRATQPNDKDIAGEKIRISGSVKNLKSVELVSSVDIFIPCNWEMLTQQEVGITWLTIQEYWCASAGVPIEGEPQFRMTLGILKNKGKGQKLFFDLKGQDLETEQVLDGGFQEHYTTLYEFDDREKQLFEIPFGEWFNLRTEIVAGDSNTGHFVLVATKSNGEETVIFDKCCQTFATGYLDLSTNQPLYTAVSPLKLYTSEKTLKAMRGQPLDIYFDNWQYKALCINEE